MEYDNFLSPESITEMRKSGGARESKMLIDALQKRKVWMGNRLRSPQSNSKKKSKVEKQIF